MKCNILVFFFCFRIIFWIGDLNYRIDDTIEQVKRKIEGKDYKYLLDRDQVRS